MFKNALIYKLIDGAHKGIDSASFQEMLSEQSFRDCNESDISTFGFVSPNTDEVNDELFVRALGGFVLVAKRQEKIIPSSAVNAEVDIRVKAIQAAENRPVGRKEKLLIKDDVMSLMAKTAFVKNTKSIFWFSPADGLIIVNERSRSKAEDCLGLLRAALGSLPVKPVSFELPISPEITSWVYDNDHIPNDIDLGDYCEMESRNGSKAKFKGQDLTHDDVLAHIESGKFVTCLEVECFERVSFKLDDVYRFMGLNFFGIENDDVFDSEQERFISDVTISVGEVKRCHELLSDALSGENNQKLASIDKK